MGWFSKNNSEFVWDQLEDQQVWGNLWQQNELTLIFKHSTRCSISDMALKRFEREWSPNSNIKLLYLDLIRFREISNKIAEDTNVTHQSPQVIVFKNGVILYHASHNQIDATEIQTIISNL
jgi:bacillithiol system protein YtxJ